MERTNTRMVQTLVRNRSRNRSCQEPGNHHGKKWNQPSSSALLLLHCPRVWGFRTAAAWQTPIGAHLSISEVGITAADECEVSKIKGTEHIAARCSHSDASGTAPTEIASQQFQQPSAIVYCLVLQCNHLVGYQADLLPLLCSIPEQGKGVRAK